MKLWYLWVHVHDDWPAAAARWPTGRGEHWELHTSTCWVGGNSTIILRPSRRAEWTSTGQRRRCSGSGQRIILQRDTRVKRPGGRWFLIEKQSFPSLPHVPSRWSAAAPPSRVHPPLRPPRLRTRSFLSLLWTRPVSPGFLPVCLPVSLPLCRSESIVWTLGVTNGLPESGRRLRESVLRGTDLRWMEDINRTVSTVAAHLAAAPTAGTMLKIDSSVWLIPRDEMEEEFRLCSSDDEDDLSGVTLVSGAGSDHRSFN